LGEDGRMNEERTEELKGRKEVKERNEGKQTKKRGYDNQD
jgi:hypothetical protein